MIFLYNQISGDKMQILGIDIVLISITLSFASLVIAIIAIIVSIYLNKRSLNVPKQRESINSFLMKIEGEIEKHKKLIEPAGNARTIDYFIYYNGEKSPNYAISSFIDLLNDFKEKPEYQLLNKKHKKEINHLIDEWENYDSNDICSPEIYISKIKYIKRKFLNFL